MTAMRRLAAAALLSPMLLAAACSSPGDLAISNDSPHVVTVLLGDEDVEVSADGGAVMLGYGCTAGDVVIMSASGQATTLTGPICSDLQIEIDRTGQVSLAPAERTTQ